MPFDADTALTPAGDGAYDGAIAPGWGAGGDALGGYVMAIVLRGMLLAVDDPARRPRSLTVHFLRPPVIGPVTVRPVVERAGRSLSTVSARMEQDGRLVALGLGAFSAPRPGPPAGGAPMPAVDPPGDAAPAPLTLGGPGAPGAPPPFARRMILEPRFGDPPFSGSDRGLVGGWMALREERPVDALTLCVLADAWFPAPWARLHELAPAPTVDLTVHFRAPLPLPYAPVLGRFESRLVRDGFFDEDGDLWAPDGTLVAQSRQLGLLIR